MATFYNIYRDKQGEYLSDQSYDTYFEAFENRDAISTYVETVEVIRQPPPVKTEVETQKDVTTEKVVYRSADPSETMYGVPDKLPTFLTGEELKEYEADLNRSSMKKIE